MRVRVGVRMRADEVRVKEGGRVSEDGRGNERSGWI